MFSMRLLFHSFLFTDCVIRLNIVIWKNTDDIELDFLSMHDNVSIDLNRMACIHAIHKTTFDSITICTVSCTIWDVFPLRYFTAQTHTHTQTNTMYIIKSMIEHRSVTIESDSICIQSIVNKVCWQWSRCISAVKVYFVTKRIYERSKSTVMFLKVRQR